MIFALSLVCLGTLAQEPTLAERAPGVSITDRQTVHVRVEHTIKRPVGTVATGFAITDILPEPTAWSTGPTNLHWTPEGGKIVGGTVVKDSFQCVAVPVRRLSWTSPGEGQFENVVCEYDLVIARRSFQASRYLKLTTESLQELPPSWTAEIEAARKTVPKEIADLAHSQIQADKRLVVFVDAASRFCGEKLARGVLDAKGKPLGRYDVASTFAMKSGWCGPDSSLFRAFCIAAGIPAREASGYALKRIGVVDGEVNMSDQRGLPDPRKDGNAHVWAEIFLPRVGWVEVNVGSRGDCFDVPETFVRVSGTEAPFVTYRDARGRQVGFDPFSAHISVTGR